MRLLIFSLLLFPFLSLAGKSNSTVSLDSIQGAWDCIYSVWDNPMVAADEMPPYGLAGPDKMLIESDSLFEFNYPCQLVSGRRVIIKNNILEDVSHTHAETPGPVEILNLLPKQISMEGDTLVIRTESPEGYSTERRFIRTSLDTAVVSKLKRYTLNDSCLQGTWKLETAYDSGYDGLGMVDYEFPFQPQHTIVFSTRKDYSNNTIWLKVNGSARPFDVLFLSASGYQLDVQTKDWYHGYRAYTLHYTKQ